MVFAKDIGIKMIITSCVTSPCAVHMILAMFYSRVYHFKRLPVVAFGGIQIFHSNICAVKITVEGDGSFSSTLVGCLGLFWYCHSLIVFYSPL